jgi:hypothetical protein
MLLTIPNDPFLFVCLLVYVLVYSFSNQIKGKRQQREGMRQIVSLGGVSVDRRRDSQKKGEVRLSD